MLATTLLRKLLGINNLIALDFTSEDGNLLVYVRPTWHTPRCSCCGRKVHSTYDTQWDRSWRHLDFGGVRVYLHYDLRRVCCKKCGVVVEKVPWSSNSVSRFTDDFEEHITYMAQRTDKTSVEHLMRITWRTVGRIIERVVSRKRPEDPLSDLSAIGIDELSYRKHHHYITLVTDHDKGKIVWGEEGKDSDALIAFFDQLGEERCKKIKIVTMDMSKAYVSAVRLKVPQAQIVFDRFHVEKLVHDALDDVRREEWRLQKGTEEGKKLKRTRWPLLKRPWNLLPSEKAKLSILQKDNKRLYRAYLLKEKLGEIFDTCVHDEEAREELMGWLSWASRSRLPSFVKVAQTIKEHLEDILAYFLCRLTNGLIEGLNNKARMLTRRAFGFHSAQAFISMIMLCCSGLNLSPIHKEFSG
jgi:transposase